MLEYRVPGRLFVLFCTIYCASSVWELNWRRQLHALVVLSVGAGLCIALPMPWLRLLHGNPYILVGGILLACGLVLNLYYLTVRRGERLAQVVRFIRVLILVLLLAGVMQLTGRLEETSMLPLWGFGLVLETLITVVLGLREQRQFTDLTRSLEEASSLLTQQRVSLKDDLTRLHISYESIAAENEALLTANSELKLAMGEVSSVATAIKRKQQRMHFAELLGFRLAGLGHDLMNPLGLARGIMELLPEETWDKHAQKSKLEFIEEVDRMTSLRTAVRIFGRPEIRSIAPTPDTRLRVFEVAKTIESSIELFRLSGTSCQIETKSTSLQSFKDRRVTCRGLLWNSCQTQNERPNFRTVKPILESNLKLIPSWQLLRYMILVAGSDWMSSPDAPLATSVLSPCWKQRSFT